MIIPKWAKSAVVGGLLRPPANIIHDHSPVPSAALSNKGDVRPDLTLPAASHGVFEKPEVLLPHQDVKAGKDVKESKDSKKDDKKEKDSKPKTSTKHEEAKPTKAATKTDKKKAARAQTTPFAAKRDGSESNEPPSTSVVHAWGGLNQGTHNLSFPCPDPYVDSSEGFDFTAFSRNHTWDKTMHYGPCNLTSAMGNMPVFIGEGNTSAGWMVAWPYESGNIGPAYEIPTGFPFEGRTVGGMNRSGVFGTQDYGSGYND